MAKKQTYIDMIREQVKADHNGKVPEHLELTIRNYATALQSIALYTYGALLSIIRNIALYGTEQYSLIKEIDKRNYGRNYSQQRIARFSVSAPFRKQVP